MQATRKGKIFLGGLSDEITVEDLTDHFKTFGRIINCQVMINTKTNRSKGYGFVTFFDRKTAFDVLNAHHSIKGIVVDCKEVTSKNDQLNAKKVEQETGKKLYIDKIPLETKKSQLYQFFSNFGSITELNVMHKTKNYNSLGFAFLTFEDQEISNMLLSKGRITFNGSVLQISKALSKNEINSKKKKSPEKKEKKFSHPLNQDQYYPMAPQDYDYMTPSHHERSSYIKRQNSNTPTTYLENPTSTHIPSSRFKYPRMDTPKTQWNTRYSIEDLGAENYEDLNYQDSRQIDDYYDEYEEEEREYQEGKQLNRNSQFVNYKHKDEEPKVEEGKVGRNHREINVEEMAMRELARIQNQQMPNSYSNLALKNSAGLVSVGDFARPIKTSENFKGPQYFDVLQYMYFQKMFEGTRNKASLDSFVNLEERAMHFEAPKNIGDFDEQMMADSAREWSNVNLNSSSNQKTK